MGVCRRDDEYGVCTRILERLHKPRRVTVFVSNDFRAHLREIFAFLWVEGEAKQFFEVRSELVGKEQFGNQVASLAVSGGDTY
jgi:hypothetical protein